MELFSSKTSNPFLRTYLYTRPWATSDTIVESLKLQIHMECFQSSLQTYTRCLRTFMCCVWAAGSIIMPLSNLLFAQILGLGKNLCFTPGLQVIPLFGVVKAPHPHGMFSTFTPNMYKMFENFHLLCMGSRIHHHAIDTTLMLAQIRDYAKSWSYPWATSDTIAIVE